MQASGCSGPDMCAVCRDHIAPGQIFITLCQHTFCKTDITRCRNCPVCRQPLALTASAAALAGSLRAHRDLFDAVLPYARRAVAHLSPVQGAADESAALEAVERLLGRVQRDEEQWRIQHDLININQFVMLTHTPAVSVMLWPTLLAVVMTDRGRAGERREDMTESICQLDDSDDELSRWLLDFVHVNIDWARRAAEAQYETHLADGNLTRAAGRMWEWKRSAAMQNHMVSLGLLVDNMLIRPGGRRSRREVHDARQRVFRARYILMMHAFAATMMQLTEHLRFTVVQLGVDRDAVPVEVTFLAQAMITPPDREGDEEGAQLDFQFDNSGQEEEDLLLPIVDAEYERHFPGFGDQSASPVVAPTTTTRVTRGPRQR